MSTTRIKRFGVAAGLAGTTFALLMAGLPYGPLDFVQIALGAVYTTPTPTPTSPTPTPAATSTAGGGGGGGGTTTTTTTSTTTPPGTISASQLTGTAPAPVTVTVNVAAGANVVSGNVGLTLPPAFTGVANAVVSITPQLPPDVNISALAGNVVASPNGTVFDLSVKDPATGQQITSFNTPVTFTVLPNAADRAVANGDTSILNVIYFTAPNTLPIFDPLNLRQLGQPVPLFQPNVVHNADGTLSWANQNGAGVVQAVVANPVTYVQTLKADTPELSSFQPDAQTFGTKPQFSYLQVVEPQLPVVNKLVVLDPDTGNYSYVNATDVGPSGPPPAKSAAGVVRGVLNGAGGSSGGVLRGLLNG
jgi:hypothetical protein